jgi:phage terminase large subunit
VKTKQITWNNKQKEVIESLIDHNKIFVEGGVRSGKSFLICWIIDYLCSRTPGMTALVLRKSYESIKTDTHMILKHSPGFLTQDKGVWADSSRQFNYNNGSRIYFRHAEGAEHLLGITAGLIFFEQVELVAEQDFDLIKNTRLSQWGGSNVITREYLATYEKHIKAGQLLYPRNYLFMTANPRAGWLKGRYIDKPSEDEGIKHFHVSTFDNLDNLPADYLADMSNASDEFKRIYFDGSWEFNSGLIYPEFTDKNVVEPEWEVCISHGSAKPNFTASECRTFVGIDPGYSRSKFAVLMTAVLPTGQLYVFDEVVHNGKGVEEYEKVGIPEIAAEIKNKFSRHRFLPSMTIIDYSANTKVGGMESISGQLQRLGITTSNSIKTDEIATIFRIKQLLKERKIIINSRCRHLIRELGLFRWHEKKLNKPVDEDNDCLDALRYIVNQTPRALDGQFSPQELFDQTWNKQAVYKNWLKTWYGKEQKPVTTFKTPNHSKLDFGL